MKSVVRRFVLGAVGIFTLMLMASGCVAGRPLLSSQNTAPPTELEKKLFSVVTNTVTVTNVVTEVRTNQVVQTVTKTNEVGMAVPIYLTNQVVEKVFHTNVVDLAVPQLVLGPGSQAATAVGGAVAEPFGWGGLVSTVIGGLLAGYLGLRNRALRGDATAASQVAGALTQNIETLLEVLSRTPQGQAVLPAVKQYLMKNQTSVGVVEQVSAIMAEYLNKPEAKGAAEEIVKALQTLKT